MTKINEKLNKELLKMTNSETITSFTKKSGSFNTPTGELTVEKNNDYFRIYGSVSATNVTSNGDVEFSTSLRPKTSITINNVIKVNMKSGVQTMGVSSITINTSGVGTLRMTWASGTGETCRFIFVDTLFKIN